MRLLIRLGSIGFLGGKSVKSRKATVDREDRYMTNLAGGIADQVLGAKKASLNLKPGGPWKKGKWGFLRGGEGGRFYDARWTRGSIYRSPERGKPVKDLESELRGRAGSSRRSDENFAGLRAKKKNEESKFKQQVLR